MADIFISYQHNDRECVPPLADLFKERGWSVWWDSHLRAGDRYRKKIKEALREARCVVVLWSKTSVEADWVEDEAALGAEKGVLVPIQLDDEIEIPLGLGGRQMTMLINWPHVRDEEKLEKLMNDIEAVLARSGGAIPKARDATHEARGEKQEIERVDAPVKSEGQGEAPPVTWKKLVRYLIAAGAAAGLLLLAIMIYRGVAQRAENSPSQPTENHNKPVTQNTPAPVNADEPAASDNSKRATEVSSPESRRASTANNQPAVTATQQGATLPTPAATPKTGNLASELRNPALAAKLRAARSYAGTGESSSQKKALDLYRAVVNQLSPSARRQLNQSLLNNAEQAASTGNIDQAVEKYGSLFAEIP